MGWLLDGYGKDATVTRLVQTRAIFLVFDVNPDGAAFDIAGRRFHEWRKNRQPNSDGTIGTDLNRNYDDHWGCCGLVSASPGSAYYRGAAPFSAPETQAMRDFVERHVFGGHQEISSCGRVPHVGPADPVAVRLHADCDPERHDHRGPPVLVALARHMAELNGYTAEQATNAVRGQRHRPRLVLRQGRHLRVHVRGRHRDVPAILGHRQRDGTQSSRRPVPDRDGGRRSGIMTGSWMALEIPWPRSGGRPRDR